MTDVIARILLGLSALFYGASFLCALKKFSKSVPRRLKIAFPAAAFVLNGTVFVLNYVGNVRTRGASFIPFVSVWQCLVFLALCCVLVGLTVRKLCRIEGYDAYFFFASAVVTVGTCVMKSTSVNYPPALQSVFFIPHILCYMFSYSLAAVGALIALRALVKKENHDPVLSVIARLLFPFMTAGLFFGAVWADQVWGEFWAWDVKECWSLSAWLNYLTALHLYRRPGLKKYARIFMITGAALVIVTFFFANVLKVPSMHSY